MIPQQGFTDKNVEKVLYLFCTCKKLRTSRLTPSQWTPRTWRNWTKVTFSSDAVVVIKTTFFLKLPISAITCNESDPCLRHGNGNVWFGHRFDIISDLAGYNRVWGEGKAWKTCRRGIIGEESWCIPLADQRKERRTWEIKFLSWNSLPALIA